MSGVAVPRPSASPDPKTFLRLFGYIEVNYLKDDRCRKECQRLYNIAMQDLKNTNVQNSAVLTKKRLALVGMSTPVQLARMAKMPHADVQLFEQRVNNAIPRIYQFISIKDHGFEVSDKEYAEWESLMKSHACIIPCPTPHALVEEERTSPRRSSSPRLGINDNAHYVSWWRMLEEWAKIGEKQAQLAEKLKSKFQVQKGGLTGLLELDIKLPLLQGLDSQTSFQDFIHRHTSFQIKLYALQMPSESHLKRLENLILKRETDRMSYCGFAILVSEAKNLEKEYPRLREKIDDLFDWYNLRNFCDAALLVHIAREMRFPRFSDDWESEFFNNLEKCNKDQRTKLYELVLELPDFTHKEERRDVDVKKAAEEEEFLKHKIQELRARGKEPTEEDENRLAELVEQKERTIGKSQAIHALKEMNRVKILDAYTRSLFFLRLLKQEMTLKALISYRDQWNFDDLLQMLLELNRNRFCALTVQQTCDYLTGTTSLGPKGQCITSIRSFAQTLHNLPILHATIGRNIPDGGRVIVPFQPHLFPNVYCLSYWKKPCGAFSPWSFELEYIVKDIGSQKISIPYPFQGAMKNRISHLHMNLMQGLFLDGAIRKQLPENPHLKNMFLAEAESAFYDFVFRDNTEEVTQLLGFFVRLYNSYFDLNQELKPLVPFVSPSFVQNVATHFTQSGWSGWCKEFSVKVAPIENRDDWLKITITHERQTLECALLKTTPPQQVALILHGFFAEFVQQPPLASMHTPSTPSERD